MKKLDQYMTPRWAAEELIKTLHIEREDIVLEPSCGDGSFLQAVPAIAEATGIEIDPDMAKAANAMSGRPVICGDFLSLKGPLGQENRPTVVVGNPPFQSALIEKFLEKIYWLLAPGGRVGLILPAYFFQTPQTVSRVRRDWSISVSMLPRTLFKGLSKPLVWAIFRKDGAASLEGFSLYEETLQVQSLPKEVQTILNSGRPGAGGVWKAVVFDALEKLGGTADLPTIYRLIEGKRPTQTAFWKEKIRQQLQYHCRNIRQGVWSLKPEAAR